MCTKAGSLSLCLVLVCTKLEHLSVRPELGCIGEGNLSLRPVPYSYLIPFRRGRLLPHSPPAGRKAIALFPFDGEKDTTPIHLRR